MNAADVGLAAGAGRPIELPTTDTERPPTPPAGGDIATAQSLTEQPAEDVAENEDADVVDYRGTDFELDLGSSRAPVVLFSLLAGLAVLLGVYATAALPVQIGAGAVAVGAVALTVRATVRRRRTT